MKQPPKPRTPATGAASNSKERRSNEQLAETKARPVDDLSSTPEVSRPRRISSTINTEGKSQRNSDDLSSAVVSRGATSERLPKVHSPSGTGRPAAKGRFKDLAVSQKAGQLLSTTTKTVLPKIEVLSTGVADRLAEREAIARHDRRNRRLLWIGLVLFLSAAIYLFGFSKFFSVDLDQIEVVGAQEYVSRDEVLEALAEHDRVPLARLDLGAVNSDLLGIKNVKSATQKRSWPQGVSVTVVERVPVAAVPANKSFTLLDIDAVEVSTVDQAPEGLPVIKIPMTGENRKTLATALTILDSLPAEMLSDIGSITASTQDDIEFTLRDGVVVQWGNSADTALKYEVLKRLRPIALKEKKKIIDLSAPTFPIIRK